MEAELSSIWGADSPGWKVVSGEDLGPKNRTYKYDVDYFAVSKIRNLSLIYRKYDNNEE